MFIQLLGELPSLVDEAALERYARAQAHFAVGTVDPNHVIWVDALMLRSAARAQALESDTLASWAYIRMPPRTIGLGGEILDDAAPITGPR